MGGLRGNTMGVLHECSAEGGEDKRACDVEKGGSAVEGEQGRDSIGIISTRGGVWSDFVGGGGA